MPCFTPLKAYRAPGGKVQLDAKGAYAGAHLELACGKCAGCRARHAQDWTIRCVHEAQMHEQNSFVTLTYAPEHLPKDGGLHIEHLQGFWKRLRHSARPLRYFACGEYGDHNLRPHFHACIFGEDFSGDRVAFKDRPGSGMLWTSKLLEKAWGLGFCSIGSLTPSSAAYVARYAMKKAIDPSQPDRYTRYDPETGECWDVRAEFVVMSLRPGLGAKWFDEFHEDVYPSDEVRLSGSRHRPPRFYDKRYAALKGEWKLDRIKDERVRAALARRKELTPERLRVKEEISELNLRSTKREL